MFSLIKKFQDFKDRHLRAVYLMVREVMLQWISATSFINVNNIIAFKNKSLVFKLIK